MYIDIIQYVQWIAKVTMTSLIREWEGSLLKFRSFFMSDFPWRACTTFRHAPLHVFRSLSQTIFLLSPSVSVTVSFLCDSRAAGSLSRGFYRFFHWRRLNGRNVWCHKLGYFYEDDILLQYISYLLRCFK